MFVHKEVRGGRERERQMNRQTGTNEYRGVRIGLSEEVKPRRSL